MDREWVLRTLAANDRQSVTQMILSPEFSTSVLNYYHSLKITLVSLEDK